MVARVLPSIGVRVPTGHLASATGSAAAATSLISSLRVESPYSGGEHTHAPAHFLGHGADHFRRFDAARDQRAQSPHGRLLLNKPAILGVQRDIVERLVALPVKEWFVGG